MRPVDFLYGENPEKKEADEKRLNEYLAKIEAVFKDAENSMNADKRTEATDGFFHVAWYGIQIMYLYEALGFSSQNSKFNYPFNIIYFLESHLQGGMKERKNTDGSTTIEPTDPKGSEILSLACTKAKEFEQLSENKGGTGFITWGSFGRGAIVNLDYGNLDSTKLRSSAQKVIEFLKEKNILK